MPSMSYCMFENTVSELNQCVEVMENAIRVQPGVGKRARFSSQGDHRIAMAMTVFAMVSSLVQLITGDEMRGRVMSIYLVAFRGGMPLGSLASGYLATLIGAPLVIGINGGLLVVVAIYFLVRSHGVRES